ncbi:hypothetical protein Kfla_5756 [Kribbella flavida DSM 17836]|uniref:Secreted protein n=1 Tax=Kribbella flavida (strain DSM 17836 / JCM 10339 / NBRC 14399) TaxID=479435 RepID=D2PQ59_KRIFD|nr:hypothetical protein [Kribbella flavida]ADB34761.1 hypothetical protein Kfla_5756 [Kribbella flavida DSM 17836]
MRQRVAAGLFVLAFAMAGAAAGHGNASGSKVADDGVRCELRFEGAPPDAGRGEGEEPPLTVTREPSGLVKGYVFTPAAFLMAMKTCTGGDPGGVMWESWQGPQHLDGVQFTDSQLAKVHVYDGDPLGPRTWKGPLDAKGVTFNQVEMDIRLGTDIQRISSTPQADGSVQLKYVVLRYSPDAKGLEPYGAAGVTVEKRCGGDWSELAKTTTDPERGEFTFDVPAGECAELELRATPDDADDTWGMTVPLTV